MGSGCVPMIFNKMIIKQIIQAEKSGNYHEEQLKKLPGFITLNFIEFCLDKGVHFTRYQEWLNILQYSSIKIIY